jgi:hypothetical protein
VGSTARPRNWPIPSRQIRGCPAGRAWLFIPGPPSPREGGMARLGMEIVRSAPPCEVLPAYSCRKAAAIEKTVGLGRNCENDCPRHAARRGGLRHAIPLPA